METGSENNFWKYVALLLYREDCVVIPAFGGFMLQYENARIDPATGLLCPPERKLGFNQRLQMNDGLLATRLSQWLKLSPVESIRMIEAEVKHAREELSLHHRFHAKGLGTFTLNTDQSISFAAEKETNFNSSSYGLKPLPLRSAQARTKTLPKPGPAIPKVKELPLQMVPKPKGKRITPFTLIATTLTIILLINVTYFLLRNPLGPIQEEVAEMNLGGKVDAIINSSLSAEAAEQAGMANIEEKKSTPEEKPTDQPEIKTVEPAPVIAPAPAPVIAAPARGAPRVENTSAPSIENAAPSSPGYYIIGGAFKHAWRAERFKKSVFNDGFIKVEIITSEKHPDFNIVSYERFDSREDALIRLADVRENFNSEAWLLVQ